MGTELHLIKRKGHSVIFDVNNMNLFNGDSISESELNCYSISSTECDPSTVTNKSTEKLSLCHPKKLHRLTVCVSNDCNLRCRYCYAKGGSYGEKRELMSRETAKNIVNFCFTYFSSIDNILFFGGEPLLNSDVIEYFCQIYEQRARETGLSFPRFSLITNGTICNDKTLSLIHDHISNVTVSIDGDKSINDINRINKIGEGSFDKISQFIRESKAHTSVKLQFEATYTYSHIKAGLDRLSIQNYLLNTFGINGIVVDEDQLDKNYILQDLSNINMEQIVSSNFDCLPNDFWQIINNLVTKKPHKFCGIFDDRITISVDGNIVGCQMLLGSPKNIVGNIITLNEVEQVYSNIRDYKDNNSCRACWCRNLCGGCVVQKFYSQKSKCFTKLPKASLCEFTRQYIDNLLYLFFDIRRNPHVWNLLIKKVKKNLVCNKQ